jgi:NADPH:quinone reductase-like Zn-dependent oxidoreductase
MKAIVLHNKKAVLVNNRALPKLRDDYMLVKTVAVALNPTDWKHVAGIFSGAPEGGTIGCDYAGIVEKVGKAVTKPFKKGDRIAGCAHGGNPNQVEDGAFAEYIMVKGDVQMKIPDSLSFEKASTIGLGAATVGQGLYEKALGLNLPTNPVKEKTDVLIYGGSTATGTLGIQYAKLYIFPSCLIITNPFAFQLLTRVPALAIPSLLPALHATLTSCAAWASRQSSTTATPKSDPRSAPIPTIA